MCEKAGTVEPNVHRGFTLIELMVTVAIVAILASIAYPSYLAQMKKGRRAAAESVLMDIAQREQQYLLDARAYADKTTLNPTIPSDTLNFYARDIELDNTATPPTFTAKATPVSTSAQAGDYTLTIDSTGAKTPADVW